MSGTHKKKPDDNIAGEKDEEQPLVAVIIVDVFEEDHFEPITQNLPKCLLPLANRPLLSHTLSSLRECGVQECVVYVSQYIKVVRDYLKRSGWEDNSGAMTITVVNNEDCYSYGDALRDLDARAMLRHDFILVTGADLIANVDLQSHLQVHKQRCKDDKNAVMTMVMRQALPSNPLRSVDEALEIALDNNGKLLNYGRPGWSKKASFPIELFNECTQVTFRADLMDVGVFVCSPAVPALFTDNFDNQNLDDFVKNIIENDLVESTLYVSEVKEGYMVKASFPFSFMQANKDFLRRSCFPLVPEKPYSALEHRYKSMGHAVYVAKDLKLNKTARLASDVIVGTNCRIDADANVVSSSISDNCVINKGATIKKSVLMKGSTIEDDCHIEEALIGYNVVIGKSARINRKCVIGEGVHIGANIEVPSGTRLVAEMSSEDAKEVFGPKAFVYVDEEDDDSDDDENEDEIEEQDDDVKLHFWGLHLSTLRDDAESVSSEEDDDEDFDDEDDEQDGQNKLIVPDIMLHEDAKLSVFQSEVLESLQRGAKDGISDENLVLEINSSRHAYNVTSTQVVGSVMTAVLSVGLSADNSDDSQQKLKTMLKHMRQFEGLLEKYCKSEATQVACLYSLELFCVKNTDVFLPIATRTIHHLYESDIVSEEAVFKWHQDAYKDENNQPRCKSLRAKAEALVKWLQESDDDDESDEE